MTLEEAQISNTHSLKKVAVDNWALFYIFSSEVSEKPRIRNDLFFFHVPRTTLEEVVGTIQVI
jgi:hypothetical protein